MLGVGGPIPTLINEATGTNYTTGIVGLADLFVDPALGVLYY